MGSSPSFSDASASPGFLAAFRAQAAAGGTMTFARFMDLALYHPELGYYRQDRRRVGYGGDTDFFTASTSGPVFGELVVAACTELLGERVASEFTFVEIGAEPGTGVLDGVLHPFAGNHVVPLGENRAIEGKCIVFSNELFDAQPFDRFVFRDGRWRELGVALIEGQLSEVELTTNATPATLPSAAEEGYHLDLSLAAMILAESLSAPGWSGLFLACDYGKSWRDLVEATPQGTARAYYRHTQSNDLLARPGQQDLTSHVCWDWLTDALRRNGFESPVVESQEAFFIHHAAHFIAHTSAAEAAHFSRKKLSLMQLLHPSHLGQKFQVLHASRD